MKTPIIVNKRNLQAYFILNKKFYFYDREKSNMVKVKNYWKLE